MFCSKCGELIPNGSKVCPNCGTVLKESDSEPMIVYASPKDAFENVTSSAEKTTKKRFCIWCVFSIISLIFLTLNYFKVSISYLGISSATNYSGYRLLGCLQGSVSISGYMVILLIITNISVFVTGIIGVKGNILKTTVLKGIMIIESIAYLIATIIPYFDIKSVLAEFDSDLSATNIGIGCYLNIILAVVAVIYYFFSINSYLKDK